MRDSSSSKFKVELESKRKDFGALGGYQGGETEPGGKSGSEHVTESVLQSEVDVANVVNLEFARSIAVELVGQTESSRDCSGLVVEGPFSTDSLCLSCEVVEVE